MQNKEYFEYVLLLLFVVLTFIFFYYRDNKFKDFNEKSWYGKLLAFRIYTLLILGFIISLVKIIF